jgi:RNA polymerase sigma-70 factor (ECF subfamily)
LVDAALNELDEEFRVVLVLRDIEDRSYEEIAELLGMAKGTVKSRLHRARAQLAKVLARSVSAQDVL